MQQLKSYTYKFFYDKDNRIVLMQFPNVPLLLFIAASILARVFKAGWSNDVFRVVAFVSLVIWALLEILTGVNYFRRILGGVVLVFSLISALMLL